ncbi:HAD family hydrolase [Agromyces mediolanus]|uniref:HAD family hydrolase n=1 Tax=Agromyces mediolanus TaxID=41986 RepID=UPI0038370DC9
MSASSAAAEPGGGVNRTDDGPSARPAPVVLFDLDDTLMAHREAVRLGIEQHMRLRAYDPVEGVDVPALWHELEERHYHAYLAGELSFEGQRRARARDFARAHGRTLDGADAGAWFDEYFERYRESWRLHDDVASSFAALEAALPGVRFGVITNGELDFQLAKLERLGLTDRFEHVVASGALGVTKPDAAIFRAAVERFEATAPTGGVAYVGDRLRTDAIGAAQAGLLGVWLNRTGATPDADEASLVRALGVLEATTLDEAAALLITHLA